MPASTGNQPTKEKSPPKLTIACVLKTGGVYTPDYVIALRNAVRRHLKVPHKFVCFSDHPWILLEGRIEALPLYFGWPGWWSKLELFRPEKKLPGDILFFDLDTVITGSLVDFVNVAHQEPIVLEDFYMEDRTINSGLMFLPASCRNKIWEKFMENPNFHIQRHRKGGDQEFLNEFFWEGAQRWQAHLPKAIMSFKKHKPADIEKPSSQGCKVVCFHGRPKPHECLDIPWVKEHWRPQMEASQEVKREA